MIPPTHTMAHLDTLARLTAAHTYAASVNYTCTNHIMRKLHSIRPRSLVSPLSPPTYTYTTLQHATTHILLIKQRAQHLLDFRHVPLQVLHISLHLQQLRITTTTSSIVIVTSSSVNGGQGAAGHDDGRGRRGGCICRCTTIKTALD